MESISQSKFEVESEDDSEEETSRLLVKIRRRHSKSMVLHKNELKRKIEQAKET